MKQISGYEYKMYFASWVDYANKCEQDADPFEQWLADRGMEIAPSELATELQEEGDAGFGPACEGYIDEPELEDVPKIPESVKKENLTLRNRSGKLLGKYEMSQKDFVTKFEPLFDRLEMCKVEEGDTEKTYRCW